MAIGVLLVFSVLLFIWYSLPNSAPRKHLYSILYTPLYLILVGIARLVELQGGTNSIANFIFGVFVLIAVFGIFHGIYRIGKEQERRYDEDRASQLADDNRNPALKLSIANAEAESLSQFPEIGPIKAKKIRQHIETGGWFSSFDEFADFLNLKEFERNRLKDTFDFTSDLKVESTAEKKPHGRLIDY